VLFARKVEYGIGINRISENLENFAYVEMSFSMSSSFSRRAHGDDTMGALVQSR